MALVTTVMTTPILLRLMRGTELEPWIQQSIFLKGEGVWLNKPGAGTPVVTAETVAAK
jgi:hypothetical protein